MNELIEKTLDNPLEALRQALQEDPSYDYSSVLPLARRKDSPDSEPPTLALPGMIRSPLLGAIDLAQLKTAPDRQSLTPESLDTLMTLTAPGSAPKGSAGMFAGIRSPMAPVGQLRRAEAMVAKGGQPALEEARKLTGWHLGPDGEWRWEIPDNNMMMKDFTEFGEVNIPSQPIEPHRLKDVIVHDELFKAYPETADLKVRPLSDHPNPPENTRALFDPNTGTIFLKDGPKTDDALGSILHEVQHYIQKKEDFAQGASPNMFLPPNFATEHKLIADQLGALEGRLQERGIDVGTISYALKYGRETPPSIMEIATKAAAQVPEDELATYIKLHDDFSSLNDLRNEANAKYWKHYGEVEARNTANRRTMTEKQRMSHPPLEHQDLDVPADKWILKPVKGKQPVFDNGTKLKVPEKQPIFEESK